MLIVVESVQTTQNLSTVVIPLEGDLLGGFLGGLFGGRGGFRGFKACYLDDEDARWVLSGFDRE